MRCVDSRATQAILGGEEVAATRRRYICRGEGAHRHSSLEMFVEMERGRVLEFNSPRTPLERLCGLALADALRARLTG